MTERVSLEQVDALAAAARLSFRKDRAKELVGAVQALLNHCERIAEVDVSSYEAPAVGTK